MISSMSVANALRTLVGQLAEDAAMGPCRVESLATSP